MDAFLIYGSIKIRFILPPPVQIKKKKLEEGPPHRLSAKQC